MKRIILITILCMTISISLLADGKEKWERVDKEDTYSVYRKENSSDINELKVIAVMQGTIKEARTIIEDINNYKNFMPFVQNSKVIANEKGCQHSYTEVSTPIVSNRDYLLKVCTEYEKEGEAKISWNPIKDSRYPERDDYVRVKINYGHWIIKKVGKDKIETIYYIRSDPGGSIPNFIANRANKKAIVDVVLALKKEIINRRKK